MSTADSQPNASKPKPSQRDINEPEYPSWLNIAVLLSGIVFVLSIVGWFLFSDPLPRKVTIATGPEDGAYYRFEKALAEDDSTEVRHIVLDTPGSKNNLDRLCAGECDFALVQDGIGSMPKSVVLVGPIFKEQIVVLRRMTDSGSDKPESTYKAFQNAKCIYAGLENSGMRISADDVLRHYNCPTTDEAQDSANESSYRLTENPDEADLLILTINKYSEKLMDQVSSAQYEFLPIDSDAIAARHPYFQATKIPAAFFGYTESGEPIPAEPIASVETTALLVTRDDISNRTVDYMLRRHYRDGPFNAMQPIIPFDEAKAHLHRYRFHPQARAYFDPFDPGPIASWVEALSGSYDLLFALCAGIFLLWSLKRQRREKTLYREMVQAREQLDVYLQKTITIEQNLMQTNDPADVQRYLNQVSKIKLEALNELTHEELRRDTSFSIFLEQCTGLMEAIQRKAAALREK